MLVLLITICILTGVHSMELEQVNDGDLLNLIRQEKYVIVLFTTEECAKCDAFEKKVVHLREELVDDMSAWVVKAVDSQLLRVYNEAKEPVLLFFRHGLPMLYDGLEEEEDIITMLTENKAPTVKELTDDTFEHLTQASSGATTGDWFVMFYSTDCVECLRTMAKWETVGAKLKRRINVALINIATTGVFTARRFDVYTPQYILFRHGKMYRYDTKTSDINSFIEFATEWYKDMRPEEIPSIPSLFEQYTKITAFLYHLWILKLTSICIGVLVIVLAVIKFRKQSDETPEDKED